MRRVIVDGMNVIGSRPDGWWNDRAAAMRALVDQLADLRGPDEAFAVVFDGAPLRDLPEGVHAGVLVAYARRPGRDAADDRIVEEVRNDAEPASLVVVTSDRALRERVERIDASVEGAGTLLRRLGS